MIEYFISNIRKTVCEPNLCPEQGYQNHDEVVHWDISGDGTGDFEEHENEASKPVVEDYIRHCEIQITLAQEYLKTLKDDDHVNQALQNL